MMQRGLQFIGYVHINTSNVYNQPINQSINQSGIAYSYFKVNCLSKERNAGSDDNDGKPEDQQYGVSVYDLHS